MGNELYEAIVFTISKLKSFDIVFFVKKLIETFGFVDTFSEIN